MSVNGEFDRYLAALIALLRQLEKPTCGALANALEAEKREAAEANLSGSAKRVLEILARWDSSLPLGELDALAADQLQEMNLKLTAIARIILGH